MNKEGRMEDTYPSPGSPGCTIWEDYRDGPCFMEKLEQCGEGKYLGDFVNDWWWTLGHSERVLEDRRWGQNKGLNIWFGEIRSCM